MLYESEVETKGRDTTSHLLHNDGTEARDQNVSLSITAKTVKNLY